MIPSLFVSHGAPDLILRPNPTRDFFTAWSHTLPRPTAIVSISAHWTTRAVTVSTAARPEMIYDFYGFPAPLYSMTYEAPGEPALAAEIAGLLGAEVKERGYDHGTWAPLKLLYPGAEVPVVTVSVQPGLDAAHHFEVGRALRPLRERGVLVFASGSLTHNLRALAMVPPEAEPMPAAAEFERWMCEAAEGGEVERMLEWADAPQAKWNHPTTEHLLPLFVALGAASDGAAARVHNRQFEFGAISMAAMEWA